MSPDVLRRKLQKKLKRRKYHLCAECGERCELKVSVEERAVLKDCYDCGHIERLYWTGKPG